MNKSRNTTLNKYVFWVITFILALAAVGLSCHPEMGLVDDSYISLRYAVNGAHGHGLVFNIGERIEGYTCFLWVFLLSGVARIGLNPVVASRAFSTFFAFCIVIGASFAVTAVKNRQGYRWADLFPAAFLGFAPTIMVWGSSGMETTMFSFLLLLSGVFLLRGPDNYFLLLLSSLAGTLAVLTRLEGVLLFPVSALYILCNGASSWRRRIWSVIAYGALFLFIFLPYFLWRYNYYGHLFPNTFYAKVGSGLPVVMRGVKYLIKFSIAYQIPLFVVISIFAMKRFFCRWVVYVAAFTIIHILYVVKVGGDHFIEFRFFLPIVPHLSLLAWCAVDGLLSSLPAQGRVSEMLKVIAIWVLLMISIWIPFSWQRMDAAKNSVSDARALVDVGKWLKENTSKDTSIAVLPIGAVGYYSEIYILDMLGLVDEHIAHMDVVMGLGTMGHEKFDADYILRRAPDYIAPTPGFHYNDMTPDEYWYIDGRWLPMIYSLRDHVLLAENYEYTFIQSGERKMFLYKKKQKMGSE